MPLKSRRPRLIQLPPCAAPWASFAHPSLLICFALLATAACVNVDSDEPLHMHIDVCHCRRRSQLAFQLLFQKSPAAEGPPTMLLRFLHRRFFFFAIFAASGSRTCFLAESRSASDPDPAARGTTSRSSILASAARHATRSPIERRCRPRPRHRHWHASRGARGGLRVRWSFEPAGASFASLTLKILSERAGKVRGKRALGW